MRKPKTFKLAMYTRYFLQGLITRFILKMHYRSLQKEFEQPKLQDEINSRVDYYNQLTSFTITHDRAKTYTQYNRKGVNSSYYFDFKEIIRFFPKTVKFYYEFGDVQHVPHEPAIVKSRPITDDNQYSVVMKLDKVRHFVFVDDQLAFADKKDMVVFRGPCYQPHRQFFVENYYQTPKCDIGDTKKDAIGQPFHKGFMSIEEQLKYKFIISIEGNDVATNLKWIMSSNSLCFMTKPKFETWFMEGALKPNYHYVLLKDDYSDLEEKIAYYLSHPDAAQQIINQAQTYVSRFTNERLERWIGIQVLEKYFKQSGQL